MNYYNYFTEIEEHFVRRRGKHLLISPMDWSLIATWRDSGVPLHIALRGIDRAMDHFYAIQRRPTRVSSLFYCHESVMEEFANYLDARVGSDGSSGPAEESGAAEESDSKGLDRTSILGFLHTKISEIKALEQKHSSAASSQLRQSLSRIGSRLEDLARDIRSGGPLDAESLERDLNILEESLVSGLRDATPAEEATAWEAEARKELKVYRKRLPKETYSKIQENYLRGRLHSRYEIGELSLFQL